jgi:hypothetical protein
MFGFLIRLRSSSSRSSSPATPSGMKVVPFGLTIVVTHLGLLF